MPAVQQEKLGGGGPQHPATMFYFDFFFLDSKIRGLKTFAKTCIIYWFLEASKTGRQYPAILAVSGLRR